MKLAIALLRVSTDKQFHFGDSIDTQKQRVDLTAERDGASIISYFIEHYSGRKTDRVVIEELLVFLDTHPGEISTVYIVEINRFTRAGTEVYLYLKRQLHQRGVDLCDAMGVIQKSINTLEHTGFEYDWSITSPSRTAEVMQAEYANQEVNQILTRTIGQQIKLAQAGYQTRSADFGFRNIKITKPDGKKATIMEALEPEASWVRAVFELRAAGAHSDQQICDHVNVMGYRSRVFHRRDKRTGQVVGAAGQSKLYVKQLQRLISKPIYCGIRVGKWTHDEPLKVPFPGLVSVELFNRANHGSVTLIEASDGQMSVQYGQSRKRNSHREKREFILRHVVTCPQCRKPFWASKSRGKSGRYFGYFHCNRGHKAESYSEAEFQKTVGSYLNGLAAKPGFLGLFREVVREVWVEKSQARLRDITMIDDHKKALQLKQDNALERLTTSSSSLVQSKLENEIEEIEKAIEKCTAQRPTGELETHQIDELFQKARHRLEHPVEYAMDAGSKPEIEKVWRTIFLQPPTIAELESGTPDLTLLYRLNRDFKGDKRQMAADLSANWNSFNQQSITSLTG